MRVRKVGLWLLICVVFLGLSLGIGLCSRQEQRLSQKEKLYESLELFTDAITIIQDDFVEEIDSKDLIYGAMKGMLSSLDPYSQFMDPETYKEMKVTTEGEFGGLGIEISIRDNLLTVISPIADTPAYKAGLKANDKILKIDGESTKDITLMEAVKKLRGKPKTSVDITILREGGNRLLEFTIVRDIIKIESIKETKIVEDKIGYVRLIEFQERTTRDLEKALKELSAQGMNGLILDLRNNPGGLLSVAVEVTDLFLPGGKVIVSTRGRDTKDDISFKSHSQPAYLDYPIVILINEGSASGSEIVAGALQDNKRAILVGTKTFGKGSVQTIMPLPDASAIRLTTSKYYLPGGESIHEKGIMPNVGIDEKDYVAKKNEKNVFEELEEPQDEQEKKELKAEEEEYDIQLERAIDLIKGIIAYRELSLNE